MRNTPAVSTTEISAKRRGCESENVFDDIRGSKKRALCGTAGCEEPKRSSGSTPKGEETNSSTLLENVRPSGAGKNNNPINRCSVALVLSKCFRGQRELQRRYSHWKDVLSGVGYVLPNEGGWQGSELRISGGIQLQPHGQRGVRVYYSRSIRRILGNCITKIIWVSLLGF
jgi:hypothetical protein